MLLLLLLLCLLSCDGEEDIMKRAFQAGSRNRNSKKGRGRSVKVMAVFQVSLESKTNVTLARIGTRGSSLALKQVYEIWL